MSVHRPSASAATAAHPLLVGQDGPGFTITLKQGERRSRR
jgi:hypothetical protein